jgi:hypothetical protein
MPGMRVLAATVLAAAGFVALSCGGITDPSKNTVDTFSGTVAVGGEARHPFSASKTGELSVKLTALAPASNTFVGLIWAQAGGDGNCANAGNLFQQNNFAQLNVPALSGAIISGRYCIIVYDSGAFAAPQNYTISVSHP